MSYEKVYALSLLACVLYSFGLLMFRWVYNYTDTENYYESFFRRIAYGRYQHHAKKPWPRLALDIGCCLFCMAVGFVPVLNIAVAVVATIAILVICLSELTSGL